VEPQEDHTFSLSLSLSLSIYIYIYIHTHTRSSSQKRELFQTNVAENIKTHMLCSITSFRTSCRLPDNVGKYSRARRATDGNRAHALCILQTQGYKYKFSEYVILYVILIAFSTATMLTRTRSMFHYTYILSLVLFRTALTLKFSQSATPSKRRLQWRQSSDLHSAYWAAGYSRSVGRKEAAGYKVLYLL
jgi:hypothetical protein